ncbi:MAG: glycoside hydrolase family 2 TIM barrel-domain containing protein [Rikenellaceae bacterium]
MRRLFLFLLPLLCVAQGVLAREIISVNDNWRFYFSSENSADYARTISLPHTWSYDQSNILVSSQPTTANYIREIYAPSEWQDKRIFIKFYGVQSVADLMVNGRYIGEHRGGATAFTFELTNQINIGQNNRLHVIVNNAPHSDVLPTSHEEDLYGGIYRDVEIIVTDKSIVSPLYYGSDGVFVETKKVNETAAEGEVRVFLDSTTSNNCQLTLSVLDDTESVVYQKITTKAKVGDEPVTIPFVIEKALLWSPEEPNLYKFSVNVNDGSGSDVVEVRSGLRMIEYLDNGFIKINDKPIQLRSVSLYHDYPHVGGAPSMRDIESDMILVKELGANTIRSVSHPHHPALYDICDTSGKLAWIDFPFVKAPFLSDVAYYPTTNFHNQGEETLREIITQNYNHPSVVMWGVFSLLTTRGDNPVPYIKELNKLAKELDSTRPTVAESDQDGEINQITDLIAWNQSMGWDKGLFSDLELWCSILHSNWGSMRSAVTYGQNGRIDQQSEAAQYKSTNQYSSSTWKPEGRQRQFHEEYADQLLTDSLFWGVCLNSMFDFKSSRNALGENNSGLVTFDRRTRKDIFYLYKARWNDQEPTLHIADKRNKVSTSPLYKIVVYASDTIPPTLYTSSDTISMKRVSPWVYRADSLMLTDGINKFKVQQGELTDSSHVVLQSSSSTLLRKPRSRP